MPCSENTTPARGWVQSPMPGTHAWLLRSPERGRRMEEYAMHQRLWKKLETSVVILLRASLCGANWGLVHMMSHYYCLFVLVSGPQTYYSSISTPDVHQGPWSGSQHPEDVVHLCWGRWDEREADFPQCRSDKRSGHCVQGDQRPTQHPRDDETESAFGLHLLHVALSGVQKQALLWHDAILTVTPEMRHVNLNCMNDSQHSANVSQGKCHEINPLLMNESDMWRWQLCHAPFKQSDSMTCAALLLARKDDDTSWQRFLSAYVPH